MHGGRDRRIQEWNYWRYCDEKLTFLVYGTEGCHGCHEKKMGGWKGVDWIVGGGFEIHISCYCGLTKSLPTLRLDSLR